MVHGCEAFEGHESMLTESGIKIRNEANGFWQKRAVFELNAMGMMPLHQDHSGHTRPPDV
jgi:hypothetical protein